MIIWICVIGIILNFITIGVAASSEPNGAMGMGPLILFAFIPYLIAVLGGVTWCLKQLGVCE